MRWWVCYKGDFCHTLKTLWSHPQFVHVAFSWTEDFRPWTCYLVEVVVCYRGDSCLFVTFDNWVLGCNTIVWLDTHSSSEGLSKLFSLLGGPHYLLWLYHIYLRSVYIVHIIIHLGEVGQHLHLVVATHYKI